MDNLIEDYGQDLRVVYRAFTVPGFGRGEQAASFCPPFLGGLCVDRLSTRDVRWHLWFPALAVLGSLPLMLCFLLWPAQHALLGGITAHQHGQLRA